MASITQTLDSFRAVASDPGLRAALETLDPTLHSVGDAAASIRGLANRLDNEVGPLAKSLSATVQTADGTLGSVRSLVEPGSPLAYQLSRTLADLAEAARAFRALATELERNPSVLVRGKAPATVAE
jgi:paraquat-inducible protein B